MVPIQRRDEYNFHTLVNDENLYVSDVYLAENNGSVGCLRIGVACQEVGEVHKMNPPAWMADDGPHSFPTSSIGHGYKYRARVEVESFRSMEMCCEDSDGQTTCLGMRFYGGQPSVTIGEWRWDKDIRAERLPTATTVYNERRNGRGLVTVTGTASRGSIEIAGILEWWIGPWGSEVVQCHT